MIWRKPIDYHGSRTYGPAVRTPTTGGKAKHIGEFCFAWARQQFRAMLRFGIAPVEPTPFRGSFSLLGSNGEARMRADDCPFPQAPARDRRTGAKAR